MTTWTKTELFRDMTTERLIALQDEYEYKSEMCGEAVNSWTRMADAVRKELASRVTYAPRTRPALTRDGVVTGMLVTLEPSIGWLGSGKPIRVPIGTCITRPICGGEHPELGRYQCQSMGLSGPDFSYRA